MRVQPKMSENRPGNFRGSLSDEFNAYLFRESQRFAPEDTLRIDLHCHDMNSDTPDELWGRILGLPETWLDTGKLVKRLNRSGSDVLTITNHNNARSCWALLDKGYRCACGCGIYLLLP